MNQRLIDRINDGVFELVDIQSRGLTIPDVRQQFEDEYKQLVDVAGNYRHQVLLRYGLALRGELKDERTNL